MAHGFGRGRRQVKHWHTMGNLRLQLTGDGTTAGPTLGLLTDPFTILRMIGEYTLSPTSAPAANDGALVTVGIGVFSGDAVALGATALPDPVEEAEYPWLYWASHPMFYATTSADPSSASGSLRHTYDIRSMRKVKPREDVAMAIQYVDISGAPPLTINVAGNRVLIGEGG